MIQTPIIKFKQNDNEVKKEDGQEDEVKKKGLQKLKEKIKANRLKMMQTNLAVCNGESNEQNETENAIEEIQVKTNN